MSTTREQIEAVMRGWGLTDEPDKYGDGIHSWRCEHPDQYGKCDCFARASDEICALAAGSAQTIEHIRAKINQRVVVSGDAEKYAKVTTRMTERLTQKRIDRAYDEQHEAEEET